MAATVGNWSFSNNAPTQASGLTAPTYNNVFTPFLGGEYMTGYDPALATTLSAAGAGGLKSGLAAFLQPTSNMSLGGTGGTSSDGAMYSDDDMNALAKQMGIDTQGKSGLELQQLLSPATQNYMSISGLSEGWNPTGNARGANDVLYQIQGDKVVPLQQGQNYNAPTTGGFLAQNPGILAPLAVVGGGLAAAYLGAGAAAGGAAEGGAAGGGAAGTAGAGATGAGAAGAAGAGGAGTTGLSGSIANALGLGSQWGALPAWGQGAITGSLGGGLNAGLSGQNIIRGMAMGGLTGGLGAVAGPAISSLTGMPGWAGSAVGSAGIGGLTGGWKGALAGGLGSLANTGLGGGALGSLGSKLVGYGLGGLMGGGAGGAGAGSSAGGLSGGGQGGSGSTGSDPLSSPPALPMPALGTPTADQLDTQAYLQQSYAPVAQEAQRQKLVSDIKDNWSDYA